MRHATTCMFLPAMGVYGERLVADKLWLAHPGEDATSATPNVTSILALLTIGICKCIGSHLAFSYASQTKATAHSNPMHPHRSVGRSPYQQLPWYLALDALLPRPASTEEIGMPGYCYSNRISSKTRVLLEGKQAMNTRKCGSTGARPWIRSICHRLVAAWKVACAV